MLKQTTRSLFTAVLLLLLLAASSALAADGLRPATGRAAHHTSVRHKTKRGSARKHKVRAHREKGVVHQGTPLDADVASVTSLLGSTTVESNYDSLVGGQAEAFRLEAGTTGPAGVVHVYISSGNAAHTLFAGLYSNAGNHPGSLLSSGSAPASAAGTWTAVSISPVELVSGRTYWLAILGTGGWLRYRDRAGGACPSETSAQTNLTALPASWKNGTVYYDCPASAYVTPAEAPPLPAAPANTALPSVSGSAVEGQTLSASTGTWSGSPTSYAYQWETCDTLGEGCLSVAGATSSSYKLLAMDVGATMRAVVAASNAGGSTAASSAATATVAAVPPPPPAAPANSALPSIAGSAVEGDTLTASTGTWSGSPTSYAYQWEDCNTSGAACSSIGGAAGSTYRLVAGDVGHTVRVVVTATNAGGSTPASSAATATVAPPPAAPANTGLPSVSGSAVEGDSLSAGTGTWSGSPMSYAYQWEDCNTSGAACSSIGGAAGSTYRLVAGDVGHTVRVVVTATNAGGSTPASSSATATVTAPPAPTNTALPTVTGSAVEGQTLSASTGTWTGSPTSYAYQWEDCDALGEGCLNVSGATSSTYKLASSDVGSTVRVAVTATNAGGSTKVSSAATGTVVPPAPANTALPSVSGSAVEGQTLSASTGTWTGSPTSYAYQWEDCNTSGEACSDVSGATSASYKLASSDVGHTARVVVTAANAGGSTPSSSAATAIVAAESSGLLVGSSTVQASGDTSSAGSAEAFEYTASASGTVHSLSLYVNTGSTASSIVVGLYSNASGNPGSLLASATIGSPKAGGWNAVGVSPVAVSSGSVYWLAALAPSGTLAIRDVGSDGGPTKGSASDSLKELPSSWSSGSTWANSPASFDASGEVVSAPSAPTNTVLPAITGSATERDELTASEGTWSGSPTSYAYQWEDCNSSGEACSDISGATASSYTLGATDTGHTVRVVVTASNAGGSTAATSIQTGTVSEAAGAPTNTAAPAISGSYEEGQRLTATSGTWTGEPVSSYGYQWERCSSESCLAISGATGAEYRLGPEDVGKKMRVEVAAHGAGSTGYASSAESPTVTGATESYACSMTASETSKIKADLEKAAAGERVCIAEGTYGHVTLGTLRYAGTVTLSPAPGKRVNIAGMKLGSVEHLAIEHLNFTEELENEPGSGDEGYLTIDHDSFGGLTTGDTAEGSKVVTGIPSTASMAVGNAIYAKSISNKASNQSEIAAVLSEHEVEIQSPATSTLSETVIGYGPGTGIYTHPDSGGHTKNFTAEWDTFAALGPCVEKSQSNYNDCGSYKGGQCMTLDGESENVTLAYNTCGPYVAVHYIQVAGKHITVEHNDFLGPSARHDSESHQNYIQIAAESSDITFSNNIMWRTNAENGFELERYSAATSAEKYENITIDNNLEVQNGGLGENAEAPGGIGFDLCPVKGLTMEHNTLVEPSSTGINLRKEGTGVSECDPGDRYTIRHDLVTKGSGVTQPNFSLQSGACEAECESAYIVTQDATATGEHAVTGWSPSWKVSSWNPVQEIVEGQRFPVPPAGYYIPEGLSASGYEGNAGP